MTNTACCTLALVCATFLCGCGGGGGGAEAVTLLSEAEPELPNSIVLRDIPGGTFTMGGATASNDSPVEGTTDPANAAGGTALQRVRRGGSWNYHSATLLTYARASDTEDRGNNHFGFRVAENE